MFSTFLHKDVHYHFIGIGGVGMGTLATLLLEKGVQVSGSDIRENFFTQTLEEKGAEIFIGHNSRNIAGADYIVYSSAITPDNPELMAAKRQNLPVLKRAELLASLMSTAYAITVAGAHGKTTTAAMIAKLLIDARLYPTTIVGGIVSDEQSHAHLGKSKYFVAEVDESDGSFLFFNPMISVITNIDYEHMDYYEDFNNLLKAYEDFMNRTRPKGILIVNGEDEHLKRMVRKIPLRYQTFGLTTEDDISARDIQLHPFSSTFICCKKHVPLGPITLSVPGVHNIKNALAAIAVGLELSLDFDVIQQSLAQYRGVQRRFQKKADIQGILFIDDYGHHPTEIRQTIRTAKNLGKKRLVVVFQPHRYSRTQRLFEQFIDAFDEADYLVVTDIYAAHEPPVEGVSGQRLWEAIVKQKGMCGDFIPKENLTEYLLRIISEGDIVLTLGAGDIYCIGEEVIKRLEKTEINI